MTREVYGINDRLASAPPKRVESVLLRQKKALIERIEGLISHVYRLEF